MSIPSLQAELEFNRPATLAECPVWDERRNLLFWVDILSGVIFQYDPDQKKQVLFDIGEHIGSFALREEDGAVLALKSGFAFYSFQSNRIERIETPESHLANNRFNDGKCDPAGRFWSGTLSYEVKENAGSLYTLQSNLNVEAKLQNLTIPNGMAWDLKKEIFYFIDSPDRTIYKFDYNNETGQIENRSALYTFASTQALPDGMTIDADGHLWVALYNGFKVVRIDTERKEISFEVKLPVPQVTSCTFGGKDLNELFITTAREHMTLEEIEKAPLSGCIFKANIPFKGLPTVRFKS